MTREGLPQCKSPDPLFAEADLPRPFDATSRLRLAIEPQSRPGAAYWNKARNEWSQHPNHVPQLIIDYEPTNTK